MPTPPRPRYLEAYRSIRERIETGDLVAGSRIPSERLLGESLGVSRTTVRKAVDQLMVDGLINDDSIVSGVPKANRLMSLTEVAGERNLAVGAKVLLAKIRAATLDEAELFGVAPGADVFELMRVRSLDGLAVAIDHDVVPLRHLPNANKIDFGTASFYESLAKAGHKLVESRVQIEAAAADKEMAKLLGLSPGAPVLVSTDKSSDGTGQVVTLGRTVFRSDRHRFLATFTRTTRD